MPQSFARVACHLTFSTRDRRRVFRTDKMKREAAAYMTGILKELGCPVIRAGVAVEHAHILFLLSRTKTIADVVRVVKTESGPWIRRQDWARLNADFAQFGWQKGYAVFSVSESLIDKTVKYIENQKEHHKRKTFQDEYREFLRRHKLEFDERYVWD